MAGLPFTTPSQPIGDKVLNGGLNSTGGALELQNNESSDLQNIDFDKFGSILKRNGYASLASSGSVLSDGLWWYEYNNAGTPTRHAINVTNNKLLYMNSLNGIWLSIATASGCTITSGNHCDFDNFLNKVFITNDQDPPFYWAGTGSATAMTVPTGLTKAKFVKQFNNYLFLGNVALGATDMPSRVYWSNIKDTSTWASDQFIEVSKDDGQEITGMKVLQDRLVIYKHRAIYNMFFTGDADIPFILPGGGKSNSSVGCIAPWSIQEVENGHVFLAPDGLYYYDGSNSYKLSYKIQKTLDGFNTTRFDQAVSSVYKPKNRYLIAMPSGSATTNDRVIVWDYFNNAFSVYVGLAPSAMATFFVSGFEERPYFSDYSGYTYRMDTGSDDYPLNVQTAINGYYWTNWKTYDDLCDQKGVPHVYIYHQDNNSVLTFVYSYDFETGEQFTQTFSLTSSSSVYGTAIWDASYYASSGGAVVRRDLTGRGRVVRFLFRNNTLGETFQIDGFGSLAHLETNV